MNSSLGCSTTSPALPRLAVIALACSLLTGCDKVVEFIDSISDGAPCKTGAQCLGGTCIEGEEWPGGYCTTKECDDQGCSNIFGAECLILPDSDGPACYEGCTEETPCREGYECLTVDRVGVCLPENLSTDLPAAGALGTSCSSAASCDTSLTCMTTFPGGYCTVLDCEGAADCPGGGRCLPVSADAEQRMCFAPCNASGECRHGYVCDRSDGGDPVCRPATAEEETPVRNPEGLADGEPCTVGLNCLGGTCLRAAEGFPGGYCTTLDCSITGCNPPEGGGAICRTRESDSACFASCSADTDCRTGYVCLPAEDGGGYCGRPLETDSPTNEPGGGTEEIDIVCSSRAISGGRAFDFEIGSDTVAFAAVPFSETSRVTPRRLLLPDGSVGADFSGGYEFLSVNAFILGNLAPVFFPAAPQFASITEQGGGSYTLEVQTNDAAPCFYVIEKTADGDQLDLNFYLVGARGLTADTARSQSSFQTMISAFERIYDSAGIELGDVRIFDVTDDVRQRFEIIRSIGQAHELASESADPGPSLDDRLSVNVFLIRGFAVSDAPGLLGVSLGIPGLPGFHGTVASGLVFTSEPLARDAESVGQTLAHELGHYLGLRHTSERDGTTDPLSDTPSCANVQLGGTSCPDARNFMFPFSISGFDQFGISEGQRFVLRRTPFTK